MSSYEAISCHTIRIFLHNINNKIQQIFKIFSFVKCIFVATRENWYKRGSQSWSSLYYIIHSQERKKKTGNSPDSGSAMTYQDFFFILVIWHLLITFTGFVSSKLYYNITWCLRWNLLPWTPQYNLLFKETRWIRVPEHLGCATSFSLPMTGDCVANFIRGGGSNNNDFSVKKKNNNN